MDSHPRSESYTLLTQAASSARDKALYFGEGESLVGRLKDKPTGVEFLIILNHLARGNAELRQEQARALRLWVEDQQLPVIGIGTDHLADHAPPDSVLACNR